MRKRLVLVLVVAATLLLVGPQQQGAFLRAQEAPQPDVCVMVIHTPSLQGTINKVSTLVTQVSPMFGPMVGMLAPKIVGISGPSMNGINLMGSFSAVMLNPEQYRPNAMVRIISITDGQAAIQSFAAAGRSEGEQDGIHTIAQMDRARFMAATPEQRKNVEQFMRKRFYVGLAGNYAALADSREACAAAVRMLKAGTLNPATACSVKGDILLNINIKDLMGIYGDTIDQKLAPIRRGMRQGLQAAQAGQPNINPQAMEKLLNVYVEAVLDIVKQLDRMELGLALETDGVHLRGCLVAKPETDVANVLRQQKAAAPDVLKFIPSDCAVALAAHGNSTQEVKDGLVDLVRKIWDTTQSTPEQQEALIQSTREWMDIIGTDFALGMIFGGEEAQGGLTLVELFNVKDPAKAQAVMRKQFDQSALFLGIYKDLMGLDIELAITENAATHQEVGITEVAILFDPATFPAEAREALKKFYGDPMILRFAAVDKYVVITLGQDSLARIKQTIELIKAGGSADLIAHPDFVTATRGFPKQTNLLVFVNPNEIAKFARSMAPPMGPRGGAQQELTLSGGIGVYMLVKGNRVEGELYVPQEFINSLRNVLMGQMGGAPPPAPPPPR